LQKYLQFIWL